MEKQLTGKGTREGMVQVKVQGKEGRQGRMLEGGRVKQPATLGMRVTMVKYGDTNGVHVYSCPIRW